MRVTRRRTTPTGAVTSTGEREGRAPKRSAAAPAWPLDRLRKGERVEGYVEDVSEDGWVKLRILDARVWAETTVEMSAGESLSLEVETVHPSASFRVVGSDIRTSGRLRVVA